MPHYITEDCIMAGPCVDVCPVDCISEGDPMFIINEEICIDCGACAEVCPADAVRVRD